MGLAVNQTDCVRYKLVCICPFKDLFQIQVYSSDTKTWKICVESFSADVSKFQHSVYWNGAMYWAPEYQSDNNILYFKLDVEQLQMLLTPEELVSDEAYTMYFGESRGHLHLISQTDREEDILRVNVYEMLRDHSGWFVKYRLQLDALPGDFPEMISYSGPDNLTEECDFQVIDVVRGKEEKDTFLVLRTPLKIIMYNVHDKSFKELYSYKRSYSYEIALRYIETLSSF